MADGAIAPPDPDGMGCHHAAPLAETAVSDAGHPERPEIFHRKIRRTEGLGAFKWFDIRVPPYGTAWSNASADSTWRRKLSLLSF
jgi:hypothetical protein